MLTSELVRAARALLRWEQRDLAEASCVSLPSIRRLEAQHGTLSAQARTIDAVQSALEAGGIQFIAEGNGGGAGVRLRRVTTKGFIFDEQGRHVATIAGREVLDIAQSRKLGTAQDGAIYGLDGTFIGQLQGANTINRTGSLCLDELERLFAQP